MTYKNYYCKSQFNEVWKSLCVTYQEPVGVDCVATEHETLVGLKYIYNDY